MSGVKTSQSMLGDFRTDSRMLLLVLFALPLGVISALVAKALLWLIAEITNIVFFQRFSSQMETLQHHHLGAWVIAAPVVGALIIGFMARFGSERIRGHVGYLGRSNILNARQRYHREEEFRSRGFARSEAEPAQSFE
jgi:hypothetical protein